MTSLAYDLARPEIIELVPYSTGFDEAALATGVLLYANENPYAPMTGAAPANINRYPAPQPRALIARMAEVYGVVPENIIAGRGADEAIDILVRTFCRPETDAIAVAPPTFGAYALAARLQGARIVEAPLDDAFRFDADRFANAVEAAGDVKLAFICSPANPTGGLVDNEDILALCDRLSRTIIVVDEAYIEFSDAASLAGAAPARENLVVLRTLSKAYSLAGARCGAAVAHADIIALLKKVIAVYPLPAPTIEAALRALSPVQAPIVRQNVARIIEERERVRERLAASPFVERIYPSAANFLFVKTCNGDEAKRRLDKYAIRVRWFDAIAPGAVRITIGAPEENDLLLDAFDAPGQIRPARRSAVRRETRETQIAASVDLDRAAPVAVSTGLGFFDHMLEQVAQHGGFSLILQCAGDLQVDAHHTVEDCMLALGEALRQALGDRRGAARFGMALPMDETRAEALIDLSGRPYAKFEGAFSAPLIGDYPTQMTAHAMRSLADSLRAAIHISVVGENDHHMTEACFKALGRALRQAIRFESDAIPSTKGMLG